MLQVIQTAKQTRVSSLGDEYDVKPLTGFQQIYHLL